MIGKTILHYKILAELGRGGMGVVYKAEDTRLNRTAAIKSLPREISASADERERFKIEARAAGALNHPNIATVHAIEEVDNELFIVMEYIDGRELKQLTIGNSQLSIVNCFNYAAQIAEGLQAAHDRGITHRDIKSSNIMVTREGQIKIMDFGLAKMGAGRQLTKEHSTLGTAAYMSPEQARSEVVDHRTDIWSYGVVLYEMLTGTLPFHGDFDQVIIYSILNTEYEPIHKLRADAPKNLQTVINKALEKNLDARYQSFAEVLTDLRSTSQTSILREATTAKPSPLFSFTPLRLLAAIGLALAALALVFFLFLKPKTAADRSRSSIAVLPFSDMSSQSDQEYFCDGMTEEILTRLAQLGDLKVIARTSVMRYKSTHKSIREIGKELNVDAILEGSVRKDGDDIKVTAQLIDAQDESHIWAEQYSRKMTHVLELQEEISKVIAHSMRLELAPERLSLMASPALQNNSVYDLVMQGKFEIEKAQSASSKEEVEKGLALIEQALRLDSTYAPAYLEKAKAFHVRWVIGHYRDREALNQKFENAKIAMRLDPHSAETHAILGSSYLSFGEREKAYESLKKALALNPSNTTALSSAAFLSRNVGLFQQAIAFYKKLIEVDPFRLGGYHLLSNFMIDIGQYDEARAVLKRLEDIAPEHDGLFRMKGILAILEKRYDAADSILTRTRELNERYAFEIETCLLAVRGQRDSVFARGDNESFFMFLGMHEEAITHLDKKYRKYESNAYLRLTRFPLFEPLLKNSRYLDLVEHEKKKYEVVLKKYGDLGEGIIERN